MTVLAAPPVTVSPERFNRLSREIGRLALEAEDELAARYEKAFRKAGREVAAYYRRTFTVVLAAGEDNLTPDPPDDALDAVRARREAAAAVLEERLTTRVNGLGISFDPERFPVFSPDLLDSLGKRASDAFTAEMRSATGTAIRESFDQGLSVPDTAKAIQAKVNGVSTQTATMLARTDLISLANGGSFRAASIVYEDSPTPVYKTWLNANDARVRPTHANAGGQTVPLKEPFSVGGHPLLYPGDPQGPPQEVIQCRCTFTVAERGSQPKGEAQIEPQVPVVPPPTPPNPNEVWAAKAVQKIDLPGIGAAERQSVLTGIRNVLEPHELGLERIAYGRASETGMAAAVWRNGGPRGVAKYAGEILVRQDMADAAAIRRRADEALRLWQSDASETLREKASRHAVWQDADDPLQTIAAHEAAHELLWQRVPARAWSDALRAEKVTLDDRLAVSEYAASKPEELFAESMALRATGRPVPDRVSRALDTVLGQPPTAPPPTQAVLTLAEQQAIADYTGYGTMGQGYVQINGQLRGQMSLRGQNLAEVNDRVALLDSAVAKAAPLTEERTVWRAYANPPEVKVGTILDDPGFVSTSATRDLPESWAGTHGDIWEIRLPPGAQALDLNESVPAGMLNPKEHELLLGRGTRLVVEEMEERVTEYATGVRIVAHNIRARLETT